jgi:hypothetical protein
MLKKDNEIKWNSEPKASFEQVKKSISEAPVLASPHYTKEFLIFSFASEHTITTVLLQKNEEGFEQSITFFSKSLRDAKLRYNILENEAYTMVKDLKSFRTYVLHSRIIAYVPTSSFKDILVQLDNDGRRGRWLAKIQEFDLEVKPTKLVKVQGLVKILAESNFRELGINHMESHGPIPYIGELDDQTPRVHIEDKFSSYDWYRDIISYLLTLQCPSDMTPSKEIMLKLHIVKYYIIKGQLYWKDPLGFLLRCLIESDIEDVINEFPK